MEVTVDIRVLLSLGGAVRTAVRSAGKEAVKGVEVRGPRPKALETLHRSFLWQAGSIDSKRNRNFSDEPSISQGRTPLQLN